MRRKHIKKTSLTGTRQAGFFPGQHKISWAAWAVLGVSLLATTAAWSVARSQFQAYTRDRLELAVRDARDVIAERLSQTAELLNVIRAEVETDSASARSASSLLPTFEHPELLRVVLLQRIPAKWDLQERLLFPHSGEAEEATSDQLRKLWSRVRIEIAGSSPRDLRMIAPLRWETDQAGTSAAVMLRPLVEGSDPAVSGTAPAPSAWVAAVIDLDRLVQTAASGGLGGSDVILHERSQPGGSVLLAASNPITSE